MILKYALLLPLVIAFALCGDAEGMDKGYAQQIVRGMEIENSCELPDSNIEDKECANRAERFLRIDKTKQYILLGFLFRRWLIYATAAEAYQNVESRRILAASYATLGDIHFGNLVDVSKPLSISLDNLWNATRTNCASVRPLVNRWRHHHAG